MADHDVEITQSGDIIPSELRQEVKDDDPRNVYDGFDQLTRAERQEMARRSHVSRRAKRRAKQLAQIEVYTSVHRELASQVLGVKMALMDGLVDEMKDADGNLDTTLLDDKRMKILLGLVKQIEDRGFGAVTQKSENKQTIDIRAAVVDLTKALQKPDTV